MASVGGEAPEPGTWDLAARWVSALLAACLLFSGIGARADEVVLKDGRRIGGKVVSQGASHVRIRTSSGGTLDLPRAMVQDVVVEALSEEESTGDMYANRREYGKALSRYRLAETKGEGSKSLPDKIARVEKIIEAQERERFEQAFEKALDSSRLGRYAQARSIMRDILSKANKEGPFHAQARRALALTYYREAMYLLDRVQYVPAMETLTKATEADPTMAMAYFDLAQLYRQQTSDRRSARDCYGKGIEAAQAQMKIDEQRRRKLEDMAPAEARLTDARLIDALFYHAELTYTLGETMQAAEMFLEILEDHSDDLSRSRQDKVIRYIVDAYTNVDLTGEFDAPKVLSQLDVALEKDPSASRAWFLKGLIYMDDNRTSEALHSLTKAIEIGGDVPDRHLKRAEVYLRIKEPELARQDLERELQVQERYEVRVRLGEVFLQGADYDRAIEQFNRAVDSEPDRVTGLLGRARAYRLKALVAGMQPEKQKELLLQAEQDVQSVIERKGDLLDAVLILGQILKDRERIDEAEKRFSQVIEGLKSIKRKLNLAEQTWLAQAYTERGDISLIRNNRNVAQSDFQKALTVRPDFAPAYAKLGEAAKRIQDHAAARKYYLKAIEHDPKNADYELHLGILLHEYLGQGNYAQEAIEHYQAYLKKGGTELRVHDWIRECRAGIAKGAKKEEG